jgi:hypothetical protein
MTVGRLRWRLWAMAEREIGPFLRMVSRTADRLMARIAWAVTVRGGDTILSLWGEERPYT